MTIYRLTWSNGRSMQRDTVEELVPFLEAERPVGVTEAKIEAVAWVPGHSGLLRAQSVAERLADGTWSVSAFGDWA